VTTPALPSESDHYATLLLDLKDRIASAQVRAAIAVNTELVSLYWHVGHALNNRVQAAGWGAKVLERLSADLKRAFPDLNGFSPRNLRYMRQFASSWDAPDFWQAPLAKLSWYHHLTLLEKLETPEQRLWYAQATLEHGWSRNVLVHQIESQALERHGAAQTNFERTLPALHSDLTRDLLKDPYTFDFLTLGQAAQERDLERGLINHMRAFLLELGVGFAFLGNQYRLEVGGEEFFVDLLFYHVRLHCYVVVELKVTAFKPEFAGKLSFYVTAVNRDLRRDGDAPTIGILLCKTKNDVVVEYALSETQQPIGVATYTLAEALPQELEGVLPTVAQLEAELQRSPVENTDGAQ
jgi:predicted nuclease of restriction endonuclease-like (RecB) superfamily